MPTTLNKYKKATTTKKAATIAKKTVSKSLKPGTYAALQKGFAFAEKHPIKFID